MKTDAVYISHIIQRCERIMEITAANTYTEFAENPDLQDVIIRSFEIIGEAATHISDEYREAHPEILFREMKTFRNVLIHQYFRLDLQQVWGVAVNDIPTLCSQLRPLHS